ncbi:MAG: alpha/beta fold hydrolase, partial [Deltaproteobacteria bacterium]|nr:alpha/beta fold hydrolase [Deltaproteobacteria bacterium]
MSNSFKFIGHFEQFKIPTVFLPGWGFDGRILRLLHPTPAWSFPARNLDPETFESDLLHFLEENNIKKVRLIGWSMGGMLGLDFASKYPEKIDSLILASLRSQWPRQEVKALEKDFTAHPETFLKNFHRKCFLGDKESYRNFREGIEPIYLAAAKENFKLLLQGLRFLGGFTIPGHLPDIPIRLIHGKNDVIAPLKEMLRLKEADIEIIDNCGHIPFLAEKCSLQIELKKLTIQEKFSRAADSYDSYAKVQAEVARKLIEKIDIARDLSRIETILEIGCGTGNFTSLLTDKFPAAKIIALDFSPEMIAKARHKLKKNNIEFICAEGEGFLQQTPDNFYDLIASNGSLQWFTDHETALRNIARTLQPGGIFTCSVFGPDSLKKLGQGLKVLFGYPGNVAPPAGHDMGWR